MRILVIGGGGREHALVWKIAQSKHVSEIFSAPGNPGIAELAKCVPLAITDFDKLAKFASENQIDLTIVGPEVPLCAGIVDVFQARGLRIFGPDRRAAQLEGSKVFAKTFLLKHDIPTAAAATFDKVGPARAYLRKLDVPIVVKADGLAAGKGVVVATSIAEAESAVGEFIEQRIFGPAGARVIIEEYLNGEEMSVMAFLDGKAVRIMASAQDHKRAFDGDLGPNTGGMGAYSPMPFSNDQLNEQVAEVFQKILAGLRAEKIEYHGVLYAGLMITEAGPRVLEFNCRFGDPEAQVMLPRMNFDLIDAILAVIDGTLDRFTLKWTADAAVCVVMVSGGYPGVYERGKSIEGLKEAAQLDKVCVFHAGTKGDGNGGVVTDGGRVLGVTATGSSIEQAARRAYEAIERIHFDGAQFRRDIAARAIRKECGPV